MSSHKFYSGFISRLWLQNVHIVVFKPVLCTCSCILMGLLENKSPELQLFCRLIVLQDFPVVLHRSFYPLSLQAFQGQLQRRIPETWCCHHHASQWRLWVWGEVQPDTASFWRKSSIWSHQTSELTSTWSSSLSLAVWQTLIKTC